MPRAITRTPGRSLPRCELTHVARAPIDVDLALAQHAAYRRALADLGVAVENLDADDAHPDAAFVEDCAVVLPRIAVIARSAVASRRGESAVVARALSAHRELVELPDGCTLDGGDVLAVGEVLYVGQGGRTNHAGLKALAHAVLEHGYRVKAVSVRGALHLKTACTHLGRDTLLAHRAWIDAERLRGYAFVDVDPAEPFGANALAIGERVLVSSAHPRTARRIEERGFAVEMLDVSEFHKAEAGLTCLSLVFDERAR